MSAHKLGLKVRFAVLKEQLDDLPEVPLELVQGLRLGMGPRPARDVADIQAGLGVPLDDSRIGAHV